MTLTRFDSALVGRLLLAEDRRDSTDVALREAGVHHDARIRMLTRRALGRIRDRRFAARDSIATLDRPSVWPEPAWRHRYRALAAARGDCGALRSALADASWPVRLRATDLVTAACASDEPIATIFRGWIDALPADATRRQATGVSWQGAAHALVALARLRPLDAASRVHALATHGQWEVRMYAARAAAAIADTLTLRQLARDSDAVVQETAIEALGALTPSDTALFLTALRAEQAPVVRAAAIALTRTPGPGVSAAANAMFDRWVARAHASERDVRVALLATAGRAPSEDRPPPSRYALPARAVALALGADVRLRVRMSSASGGGSFVVRLRGDAAPMMAARILSLARARYYDGLTWHRVEHDFVIQGGSPGRSEYVGLAQYLRDELGGVPHVRGTVGMSTRGHDTGDAQWFVNLRDNRRLDADYTVFGQVIDGMDVVDGVLEGDVISTIEEITAPPSSER
ncbi:MAG: peptidylprolyl isomerase [Gemmatimonadaceae bacterium]